LNQNEDYSIDIFYNWHVEFLKREKKNLWNLQRGKMISINYTLISNLNDAIN
jgi:hypothetical protein